MKPRESLVEKVAAFPATLLAGLALIVLTDAIVGDPEHWLWNK